MLLSWKTQKDRLARVRDKFTSDLFVVAHTKILLAYIGIGIIITAVSGYLVYHNTIAFAQNIISTVQQYILSHNAASQTLITQAITQSVDAQILKVDLAIGVFMLVILSIYAYALVRITLWPIKKAMERQRRFAANVAHELRTPLSVMKTNFEVTLMAGDGNSTEEFKDVLRDGVEEVNRMSDIARFLLNFSSFDGKPMELEMTDIDLTNVARQVFTLMEPIANQRDIALSTNTGEPIFIRGNTTTLQELLVNLVKNAIAYTAAGGSVVISTALVRGMPTLSVSDTGIGIPAKDLPNIFEPFFRGENAYSQRSKKRGSGIGLAIVREIAVLHGATISVQSEVGYGTTFLVKFPALGRS